MLLTLRQCLRMLPAGRRAAWAMLVPIAVATGALEAGAAAAVFALIQIVGDPARAHEMSATAWIARLLPWSTPAAVILTFTALVVSYHILKNLLLAGAQYVRYKVVAESQAALAGTMLRGYLAAPYALHVERNSADLRRNVGGLPGAVCDVLGSATTLLSEVLVAAGLAVVLVAASPGIALAAGVVVALLLIGTLRWTRRRALQLGRLGYELALQVDRVLQHALGGVKELKVLRREQFFYGRFAEHQRASLDLGVMGTTLSVIPPLVIETSFVVGALFVIALVTVSGAAGRDGLPLLALFTYAGFRLIPALNRVTWRINAIRGHAASVDVLYRDFCAVAPFAAGARPPAAPTGRSEWRTLSLDRVSFRYDGGDGDVLHEVCLDLCRGETLGIVGPTGAGKTTLVDVLLGLLAPSAGRLLVDGVAPSDSAAARRPRSAYVPQAVFIADDTLEKNVAFAMSEPEVDAARVQRAIGAAQLGALVAGWPGGLGTIVGERGARLSGGERQRVGIARALYHDPDLLVLDEATSALDGITEAAVMREIAALEQMSVIIVAHRFSTIRHCDRLIVLVGGRILATGTYDELLETSAEFRRLAEAAEQGAGERV